MTYLQFHAVFILPWVAVLGVVTWRSVRSGRPVAGPAGPGNRVAAWALGALVVAAVAYTTPWDNFLVATGVWGYPEGRVWFTIGYVPIEEYLFFVLQTVLTGLFLLTVLRWQGAAEERDAHPNLQALGGQGNAWRLRAGGSAILFLVAGAGAVALGREWGTYLGLILVWALPVLAMQWLYGGDLIARRWRSVVPAVLVPTLWLWLADRIAIGLEIWWIHPELTTGLAPLGLPIEEATFFLVTNLMVVFGMTLVLSSASWERWRSIRAAPRGTPGLAWKAVLALWALSMIPAPLAPDHFPLIAYASTGLLAAGTLLYVLDRFGRRAFLLFGVAVLYGIAIEAIGSATGIPFGTYAYRSAGPSILGVPWLVPLGWWAFSVIAVAAAPGFTLRFAAPLVLVAWDLGLDPLMVHHGFWRFDPPGAYAGVPWTNFVGWFLAGWLLVEILGRLEPRLEALRGGPLRVVFVVQAFFLTVGLAAFGLVVPAVVTALAMGAIVASWWAPGRSRSARRAAP